ncbi:MAG: S8 family serine peptidase [Ferruginibacter sp.]
MKTYTILLILFLASFDCYAQIEKLKTNGYELQFKKIDTLFYAEFPISKTSLRNPGKDNFNTMLYDQKTGIIIRDKDDALLNQSIFRSNYYVYSDGTLEAPTSQLFLKTNKLAQLQMAFGELGVFEEHKLFKGYYYLNIYNKGYSSGEQIFSLCRNIYNTGLVEIVEPVFSKLIKAENPIRPFQWNIRNQLNVPGAIVGADMKVENAWCYSTGTGIRVAVIDDGVELTHPDLQANLLPGYDATGNNSAGGPTTTNPHGTNCAGIIASIDNTIGTIGIAYNSRIIPIRQGIVVGNIYNTNSTWQSNCFNEAVSRGADIISNSWGGGSPSVQLETAIQNAINTGRSGKGCVILFAAGNNNSVISYPSTLSYVISVGASTPCDTRKRSSNDPALVNPGVNTDPEGTSCDGEYYWGSNFGTGLDILAPGVIISTTDLTGSNGYDPGNYYNLFNGTSSACPNAAGVVALILAANPNLTGLQARNILEQTCIKVGGYNYQSNISNQPNGTWSNQAGYGRIDADRAVREALSIGQMDIVGANAICVPLTSDSYTLSNLQSCGTNTVNWSSNVSQVTVSPQTGITTTLFTNGFAGTVILTGTVLNSNGSTTILTKSIQTGTAPSCSTRTAYVYVNGYPSSLGPCCVLTQIRCSNGPGDNPSLCDYYANAYVNDPTATSITWSYVSSSGYTSWNANGNQLEVTVNTNSPNGWIRMKCTTTNACGSYGWDFWFTPQGSTASCNIYLDKKCLTIERPVSILQETSEKMSISPNPSPGQFMVSLNSVNENAGIKEVIVRNKMGINVFRQMFRDNKKRQTINLSGRPTDIYTVHIFDGKEWQVHKLSLQR